MRIASRIVPLAIAKRAMSSASPGRRSPRRMLRSTTHVLIASATCTGRDRRPGLGVVSGSGRGVGPGSGIKRGRRVRVTGWGPDRRCGRACRDAARNPRCSVRRVAAGKAKASAALRPSARPASHIVSPVGFGLHRAEAIAQGRRRQADQPVVIAENHIARVDARAAQRDGCVDRACRRARRPARGDVAGEDGKICPTPPASPHRAPPRRGSGPPPRRHQLRPTRSRRSSPIVRRRPHRRTARRPRRHDPAHAASRRNRAG